MIKTLTIYLVLGPLIGGALGLLIAIFLEFQHGHFTGETIVAALMGCYFFGALPALATGVYIAFLQRFKFKFRAFLYYALAIVSCAAPAIYIAIVNCSVSDYEYPCRIWRSFTFVAGTTSVFSAIAAFLLYSFYARTILRNVPAINIPQQAGA